MRAESRIRRWTGSDNWQRAVWSPHGPAASRGARVLRLAASAATAVHTELGYAIRPGRLAAWLEVVLGAAGLAGLVGVALLGLVTTGTAVLVVCSLLAVVPLCGSLRRAIAGRPCVGDGTTVPGQVQPVPLAEPCASAATIDSLGGEAAASAATAGRPERHGDAGAPGRRHRRYKVVDEHVLVTMHAGATIAARLIDVSVSGAAISCDMPDVRVGDAVWVGPRAARVVRTLEHGFACAFVDPAPPATA